MNKSIIVLAEHLKGSIPEITFEMLGAARRLAEKINARVYALLIGKDTAGLANQLGAADSVVLLDEINVEHPPAEIVLDVLKNLIEQKQANFVFIGATNISFGIGARLSMRTGIQFINWVKDIRLEGDTPIATSAMFGGKILTDIAVKDGKAIFNILSGSFPPDAGKSTRQPEVERISAPQSKVMANFRSLIEPKAGDIDITRMDVLVSVGRGIQNPDNIPLAEELAKVLGGAVSASRPVVDQGWLPLTRQVGKSGMSVAPRLYLALGISGAPEHYEGMKGSKLIVAINTDPKAPIFDFAHYGAVVDCLELIEPLKAAIEKRKSSK